jgi:hypothetical protein
MAVQHGFAVATTIVPNDVTNFTIPCEGWIVAVAGNAVIVPANGTATITFTGLIAGQHIPIKTKRVNSTGTTATLVGVWGA